MAVSQIFFARRDVMLTS